MKKQILIALVGGALLSGCAAVHKTPMPSGGSKSDGTVDLSYTVSFMEYVQPNWEEAQKKATERCKAWGYSKARPFSSDQRKCNRWGTISRDCTQDLITRTYQCYD